MQNKRRFIEYTVEEKLEHFRKGAKADMESIHRFQMALAKKLKRIEELSNPLHEEETTDFSALQARFDELVKK